MIAFQLQVSSHK